MGYDAVYSGISRYRGNSELSWSRPTLQCDFSVDASDGQLEIKI